MGAGATDTAAEAEAEAALLFASAPLIAVAWTEG